MNRLRMFGLFGFSRRNGPFLTAASTDLEASLTLTNSFAEGDSLSPNSDFDINADAVFGMDFTGLSSAQGGMIMECGGSGNGIYVGINASGQFIARSGVGSSPIGTTDDHAYLISDPADTPSGDGTLIVGVTAGVNEISAFWNGKEIPGAVARGTGSGAWTGTGAGTYLGATSAVTVGELTAAVVYSTASSMRYYENQTVN